jgi:hypothetical protein
MPPTPVEEIKPLGTAPPEGMGGMVHVAPRAAALHANRARSRIDENPFHLRQIDHQAVVAGTQGPQPLTASDNWWSRAKLIERAESGPESVAQRTKPSTEETLRYAAKLVEGCIPAGHHPITFCAEEPRSCDTVPYRETFDHTLWKE